MLLGQSVGKPGTNTTEILFVPQFLKIYLGFLRRFQHSTGHITTGSWKGRGNQYIQFVRVVYCKLLTNGKQLPAFPLEAVPGTEPWPQRWEARVLPLCHRGPYICTSSHQTNQYTTHSLLQIVFHIYRSYTNPALHHPDFSVSDAPERIPWGILGGFFHKVHFQ